MDKHLGRVMDNLSQGVLILDSGYRIVYANKSFCQAAKMRIPQLFGCSVFEVLPGFGSEYLRKAFSEAMKNDCHFFFSAAMHRTMIPCGGKFNVYVSGLVYSEEKFLFLEFIDVTGEFERVRQLKEDIGKLCLLNRELLEKEKEIQKLAYYDSLTGVANRTLFYELAKEVMRSAERNGGMFGLLFLDIDRFKRINDTYGHKTGDRVLERAAGILTGVVRKSDVVARYGGDEFLILLPEIRGKGDCEAVVSKIASAGNGTVVCGGSEIRISFSIGASFYPADGRTIDQLIAEADRRMYQVKKSKKKPVRNG